MVFDTYVPWVFYKSSLADLALFLVTLLVYLIGRLWRRNDWSPSLQFFVMGYLLYLGSGVFAFAATMLLSGGTFDYSSINAVSHNADFIIVFDSTVPLVIEMCGMALMVRGALPRRNMIPC